MRRICGLWEASTFGTIACFVSRSTRRSSPNCSPPSLKDLVRDNPLVRALKEVVASLDLARLEEQYDLKGGYGYEPHSMLAMMLFALVDGERSSRRVEEHCKYDARYRYLMEGQTPDFVTINRFRRRLDSSLEDILRELVGVAKAKGFVLGRMVAVDGTKVASNVSQWKRKLREAAEADEREGMDEDEEARCPWDLDARTMRDARGYVQGYNVQVAVDAETGFPLGGEVSNCSSDYGHLPKVVERAGEALGELPPSVVADKGYEGSENVSHLAGLGVVSYLPPREEKVLDWHLGERGRVVCPMGHEPQFKDIRSSGGREWFV